MIKKPRLKIQNHFICNTCLLVQPLNSLALAAALAFLLSTSYSSETTISSFLGVLMKQAIITPITNKATAKIKNGAIEVK